LKNAYLTWIIASVLCSSVAHFALKLGAVRLNTSGDLINMIVRVSTNSWLVLGAILHAVALALWVIGLKRVELSVAYPFIALGFVLVSVLSWAFLGETLDAARVVGIILIASGVMVIART